MLKKGYIILISRMCILTFKMMILLLVGDIGTFELISRVGGKSPNLLFKIYWFAKIVNFRN